MKLYPPMLKELVNVNGSLVLYVDRMKDPGEASVDPYLGADVTDLITLTLRTDAGIWIDKQYALLNEATLFQIPKLEFKKGFAAGPNAKLEYSITRSSAPPETSLPLEFELKA
ncbi:hypothetical protein [Pseudomonas sp. TWP3-2]|uniref:hypothetical protein n=1 Tax=Pseudomonas sp. TWP3-2 TaxID=2804574 RepID=UPI003CF5C13F